MIARVEPLTTTRRLSGPFDYALPAEPLEVGSVVRVPFGHQRLDGVVVGLAAESELPAERLVAPSAVRAESVPADLVELALWMAAEYASTPEGRLRIFDDVWEQVSERYFDPSFHGVDWEGLREELQGVEAAGANNVLPFSGLDSYSARVTIEGRAEFVGPNDPLAGVTSA